jgi:SAM-dependent methyltransferase
VLDLTSRQPKARKIERLLELEERPGRLRVLEVGAGGGGISHYFATHPDGRFDVDAVDVHDSRQSRGSYRFNLVDGTSLPFQDGVFDVVISNHVIEHVGDRDSQLHHLTEIRRVMAPSGTGYLAVPNRWMLIEPHYRLMFLSWWPRRWRSGWLRLWGKGRHYDCEPLALKQLDTLLGEARLSCHHIEVEAVHVMLEMADVSTVAKVVLGVVPGWLLAAARPLIPTLICRIERV